MMKLGDPAQRPPVVFGTQAPTVFADDAIALETFNGTTRLSFGILEPAEPPPTSNFRHSINVRVVMTSEGAQRLCLELYNHLVANGLKPESSIPGTDARTN